MSKRKITIIIDDRYVGNPLEPLELAMIYMAMTASDPKLADGYESLAAGISFAKVEEIEDDC